MSGEGGFRETKESERERVKLVCEAGIVYFLAVQVRFSFICPNKEALSFPFSIQ